MDPTRKHHLPNLRAYKLPFTEMNWEKFDPFDPPPKTKIEFTKIVTPNNAPASADARSTYSMAATAAQTPTQSKLSPLPSLYEEVLFIYVGPKRVVFGVHKGLLCRESKYFQAAFNGSFSETEKGSIELPEEEPVVSDIVYTWLYSTKLAQPLDGKNLNCNVYTLVDLFIFGDKYDMPALCNRVMDQFSHVANLHKQLPANLCHIYNNTPKGSPLRRAISAMLVKYPAGLKYLCDEEAELFLTCPEFLLDLTKVLATKGAQTWCHKPNIMSLQPNPCEFHRHEDGEHERCYALTSNNL